MLTLMTFEAGAGGGPAAVHDGGQRGRRQVHADRPAAARRQERSTKTTSPRSQKDSRSAGREEIDFALLTDGLKAEREQGITIDVAYRHFSTPKRRFIIADTPGHEQYTRNMVTGASTANLAVILIDAQNGVLTQSKRHGFIASLLGIPHIVVAVNKMDLVDYSQRGVRGDLRGIRRVLREAARARPDVHPDQRAQGATTSSSAARTCPGTRARRCSRTWRPSTSPATRT